MIIYTIKNKVNGRQLIGQTISTLNKRWGAHKSDARNGHHHNPHFQRAWNKYGELVFSIELVDKTAKTIDELNELEIHYIAVTPNTYNIKEGGANGKLSRETRQKISNSLVGHGVSENSKEKMIRGIKCAWKTGAYAHRPPMTLTTKEKLSKAHKGKVLSEAHRKKISEGLFNSNQSSKSLKEWWSDPKNRKRMSEAHKGKRVEKALIRVKCPHCDIIGQRLSMGRWHFDNCKRKVV